MNQLKSIADKAKEKVMWVRLAAAGGAVFLLALFSSILTMAAAGAAAAFVIGAIGLVAVAAINAYPLFMQKLENRILAARKAEARANPIEELQRFYIAKKQRLEQFRQAVVAIGGQVKSMGDMLDDRLKSKPGSDQTKKREALARMAEAHQKLVGKVKAGEIALAEFHDLIEEKKFDWEFQKVGKVAAQGMRAVTGQELFDEMLADEALSSVRENFNAVFADIEMEAGQLTQRSALEFDDGMTIDLSAINLASEAVPVRR